MVRITPRTALQTVLLFFLVKYSAYYFDVIWARVRISIPASPFANDFRTDLRKSTNKKDSVSPMAQFCHLKPINGTWRLDWKVLHAMKAKRVKRNVQLGCKPKTHILFRKVHKCGSTTHAGIIMRYAFLHNLRVAAPEQKISRGGHVLKKYDVMAHHSSVLNEEVLTRVMHKDVFKIGLLREPFSKFKSAFNYYQSRMEPVFPYASTNHIKEFLDNYSTWSKKYRSVFGPGMKRNSMSQEMGTFPERESENKTFVNEFLEHLEGFYDFVIILDKTDECLVLLRRRLCWDMKDILYMRKMKLTYSLDDMIDNTTIKMHRSFDNVDYALYYHFKRNLRLEIRNQGDDFFEELEYFQNLNQKVVTHCHDLENLDQFSEPPPLIIQPSKWSAGFQVDCYFCWLLRNIVHENKLVLRF